MISPLRLIVIMLYVTCLLMAYMPFHATIASDAEGVIEISASPSSAFIKVNNMVPGDQIIEKLIIKNSGTIDFNYAVTARNEDPFEKTLFNQLLVHIEDGEEILYDGLLSEFQLQILGNLKSKESDHLDFLVSLPITADNNLQNKSASIAFDFTARAEQESAINDSIETKLPNTATNSFNFLVVGTSLLALGLSLYMYNRKKKELSEYDDTDI